MSGDITKFIKAQKLLLIEEQKRLGLNNENSNLNGNKENDAPSNDNNHPYKNQEEINKKKTEINRISSGSSTTGGLLTKKNEENQCQSVINENKVVTQVVVEEEEKDNYKQSIPSSSAIVKKSASRKLLLDNNENDLELRNTDSDQNPPSTATVTSNSEILHKISVKNINSEAPIPSKPDGSPSSLERYPSSCFFNNKYNNQDDDDIDDHYHNIIDDVQSPDTAYIPSRLSILCRQHESRRRRRGGEFSPSNYARLRASPHTGLGEYECTTQDLFAVDVDRDRTGERTECFGRRLGGTDHRSGDAISGNREDKARDSRVNKDLVESNNCEILKATAVPCRLDSTSICSSNNRAEIENCVKSVQTDIKNIKKELVQYDWHQSTESNPNQLLTDNSTSSNIQQQRTVTDNLVDAALLENSTKRRPFHLSHHYIADQRLTSEQNELLFLKNRQQSARTSSSSSTILNTMDKPKSILSNRRTGGSPRDRYAVDYSQTAYAPTSFIDGFSFTDRSEELERERLKREAYQRDLRQQIEEKRQMQAMREEQERHERELENKRLEQQMLRIQEEQMVEEQRRARRTELMRRHSDDFLRRKTELHELQRPIWQRRHADSESANLDTLGGGGGVGGGGGSAGFYHHHPTSFYTSSGGGNYYPSGSHYSPPISRRLPSYSSYNVPGGGGGGTFASISSDCNATRYANQNRFDASNSSVYCASGGGCSRKDPLSRINSLNSYDTVPLGRSSHRSNKFDRFDSLSRIDSLSHRLETTSIRDGLNSDLSDLQRRHSATQQDLSLRKSPRLHRRNSASRFEMDTLLPVPMLKARSPVAKELRNAIPFSSQIRNSNEIQRRYEDRWQAPSSVQKNIHHSIVDTIQQNRSGGGSSSSKSGSILTQLGSIRAQLQREQLRMDETLRRRKLSRTRTTVDDY